MDQAAISATQYQLPPLCSGAAAPERRIGGAAQRAVGDDKIGELGAALHQLCRRTAEPVGHGLVDGQEIPVTVKRIKPG